MSLSGGRRSEPDPASLWDERVRLRPRTREAARGRIGPIDPDRDLQLGRALTMRWPDPSRPRSDRTARGVIAAVAGGTFTVAVATAGDCPPGPAVGILACYEAPAESLVIPTRAIRREGERACVLEVPSRVVRGDQQRPERVRVAIPARLQAPGHPEVPARTVDLSTGGACLVVPAALTPPVGERLRIRFAIEYAVVDTECEIVALGGDGRGREVRLRFVDLDGASRMKLAIALRVRSH